MARTAAGALVAGLAIASSAFAHQDPPSCSGINNGMALTVLRNDGSPVVGEVSPCETIRIRSSLTWISECLIQAGTFKVITPDGTDHVVANPVPCLGAATQNAEGCTVGQATSVSTTGTIGDIVYTVNAADVVNNQITITADWASGILHQTAGNVPGQANQRAVQVSVGTCGDGLFCNGVETCDPEASNPETGQLGICVPGTPPSCGVDDGCVDRGCDEELDECFSNDLSANCGTDDGCVDRGCDPTDGTDPGVSGCFANDLSANCGVSDQCTDRDCDPTIGTTPGVSGCTSTSTAARCDELDNECQEGSCNPETGCVTSDTSGRCGTDDGCVDRGCNPDTGCTTNDLSANCGADDECTDRGCDPAIGTTPGVSGCFENDTSARCNDGDVCTQDLCDPATGCDNPPADPLPTECQPPTGCRITGGGLTPLGSTDPELLAEIERASFGGQVGAPCGCIGCFDELGHVQGSWNHVRHRRRGHFKAGEFNSLICGCDGTFDGKLCNPGDREPGPEPRPAPANMACWTGVGKYRGNEVAFRVEVEDRGEPSVGQGDDGTQDVYRLYIWDPHGQETAEELAEAACCKNPAPSGATVTDGGTIIHGNIQIHPVLPNTERGRCPVPDGTCPAD